MDFLWNYIWDTSDIFSISSLVKILLTSFFCFSFVFRFFFIFKHSYLCNKNKITRWLEHISLSSLMEKIFFRISRIFVNGCLYFFLLQIFSQLTREIFFPLENIKTAYIFASPCNILYLLYIWWIGNYLQSIICKVLKLGAN